MVIHVETHRVTFYLRSRCYEMYSWYEEEVWESKGFVYLRSFAQWL